MFKGRVLVETLLFVVFMLKSLKGLNLPVFSNSLAQRRSSLPSSSLQSIGRAHQVPTKTSHVPHLVIPCTSPHTENYAMYFQPDEVTTPNPALLRCHGFRRYDVISTFRHTLASSVTYASIPFSARSAAHQRSSRRTCCWARMPPTQLTSTRGA